ncbi:LuxR family two component transcriptional regulator [Actinomycetospora succinea]|uniref:LuxR family two component transcriptional regulator n=1 Tax=Actinomycetospora succinea TaxID=663603 RepID=A0A4R6VME6_9PSEU|nr:response regulator transcription factor [Actinomycetospora succinea]TDQ63121.1 LuxR family two component transcriptional regulator [Actinomycetospora succinea]
MITVLVVDDEPMVCTHLGTILATDEITVVGEAHDGAEAVEQVVRHRPDVVLLDIRMPGVDGLTALGHIAALEDRPAVVVLTTFDVDTYVLRALAAGAQGFLLKSTPPADLRRLVAVAAAGQTVLSPEAARRLATASSREDRTREAARARIRDLPARETEVLTALGEGLSNAAIGARLHLSEATVKGYVSRLMEKLDCDNRTQAGLLAFAAGLVGLGGAPGG